MGESAASVLAAAIAPVEVLADCAVPDCVVEADPVVSAAAVVVAADAES
ncbi:hypothetical protein [Mycolicibacterium sphagni]|nr:hypothetical protein [Mycolicibacterium sphagni]MCV7177533.1 hypothetical protein [Mycolicibacterium sphagni]